MSERKQWVEAMRTEIEKRIREYEEWPEIVKRNGVARLALADSIAKLCAANAASCPASGSPVPPDGPQETP